MRAFFEGGRSRRARDRSVSATMLIEHVDELVDLEVAALGRPPCRVRARLIDVQTRPTPGVVTFEIADPTQALLTLGEGEHSISVRDITSFTLPD